MKGLKLSDKLEKFFQGCIASGMTKTTCTICNRAWLTRARPPHKACPSCDPAHFGLEAAFEKPSGPRTPKSEIGAAFEKPGGFRTPKSEIGKPGGS